MWVCSIFPQVHGIRGLVVVVQFSDTVLADPRSNKGGSLARFALALEWSSSWFQCCTGGYPPEHTWTFSVSEIIRIR